MNESKEKTDNERYLFNVLNTLIKEEYKYVHKPNEREIEEIEADLFTIAVRTQNLGIQDLRKFAIECKLDFDKLYGNALNILKNDKNIVLGNFVLSSDDLPQIIDHAVGTILIEDKELRYYGFRIKERVLSNKGKSQLIKLDEVPILLLEDGRIISENSKPKNISFEFDSTLNLKYNRMSLKAIHDFAKKTCKSVSFKEAFEIFRKNYSNAMVFEKEEWYDLNALWDLCTYFYDMIDRFLIIKHEGLSGAAKSKGMKISANQAFNGKKFLCPTPANFFRYRHNNKATLCIEEAERLFSDTKNKPDSELVEYLNGSYEKGNTVPRQNDKDLNRTDEFDPAGFTRIGSIKPLMGALEKRSMTLHMIIANPADSRGNVEIPSEKDSHFQYTRDSAYICGLTQYRLFAESLIKVQNRYGLANRQWSVAKPIIAMAKCINYDLEIKIGKFIASHFMIRDSNIDSESWNVILACALIKRFCLVKDNDFISNPNLKELFLAELSTHGDSYSNFSQKKITALMKEIGFNDYYGFSNTKSERGYSLNFWKIAEVILRNNLLRIEDIKKNLSNVSICPISDDKLMQWYTDTFKDTSENNIDVSVNYGQMDGRTHYLGGMGSNFDINHILNKLPSSNSSEGYSAADFISEFGEEVLINLKKKGMVAEFRKGRLWNINN